ncbi:hypothetical protein [Frateuria aurantia]|uniref:Uncharacterized protein n=1 Tax=Frateuria aurantia (strain ATCC 33424 / DSM 6220 / KCTC 2777 / LMG 1558 / NBRC 3245 / NCIMB 13370) TaxID=767434 RepID=H8L3L5_FRAAD|nr:hypothetical protein [Frateuria aurantia]AFC87384.1 hypothetical protein Fraau_3056 [Frateuria aurantia DSM 6220]
MTASGLTDVDPYASKDGYPYGVSIWAEDMGMTSDELVAWLGMSKDEFLSAIRVERRLDPDTGAPIPSRLASATETSKAFVLLLQRVHAEITKNGFPSLKDARRVARAASKAIESIEMLTDAVTRRMTNGASSAPPTGDATPKPVSSEAVRVSGECEQPPGGEHAPVAAEADTQDLTPLPDKLRIAIEAHQAIVADPSLVEGRSPKKAIMAWVGNNYPLLSGNAKELIAQIANPQPAGGSPPTPVRKPIPPR